MRSIAYGRVGVNYCDSDRIGDVTIDREGWDGIDGIRVDDVIATRPPTSSYGLTILGHMPCNSRKQVQVQKKGKKNKSREEIF